MKIALTGASGFVGSALRAHFTDHVVLDRHDDIETIKHKLVGVDTVINLAGAPIIKRWSDPYKVLLRTSRIETTRTLVKAINESEVKHFISTSAIGIYPNDIPCDENTQALSNDFLGQLCQEWEAQALQCDKPTTILRFGIVLGKGGGALSQMLPPFKLGLGGPIGNGKMMMSWIHLDDLVNLHQFVIEQSLEGVYNACAPEPVSNQRFIKALGKVLRRPTLFPLPTFVLKLIYADASSVLTDSKEVYPKVLEEKGFSFTYDTIDKALEAIIS